MGTLARSETFEQRDRIFSALVRRNRFVHVLRFAVPAAGIVILGGLVLQLFVAGLGEDFGFSSLSLDRNNLVVQTPSYSSVGADGSAYQIEAASAKAALDRTDIILLNQPVLTMKKPGGATITASADAARIETIDQLVSVEGITRIADSAGMRGTVAGLFANMADETVVGRGEVDVAFANGATLSAADMAYDGPSSSWRFTRVTLMLPSTPGEDDPAATQGAGAGPPPAAAIAAGPVLRPALVAPRPMARRPPAKEQF